METIQTEGVILRHPTSNMFVGYEYDSSRGYGVYDWEFDLEDAHIFTETQLATENWVKRLKQDDIDLNNVKKYRIHLEQI